MSSLSETVVNQLIPILLGSIGTGVGWVAKSVFRAKRDLDFAHEKIRNIESRLECAEKSIYYDGE